MRRIAQVILVIGSLILLGPGLSSDSEIGLVWNPIGTILVHVGAFLFWRMSRSDSADSVK